MAAAKRGVTTTRRSVRMRGVAAGGGISGQIMTPGSIGHLDQRDLRRAQEAQLRRVAALHADRRPRRGSARPRSRGARRRSGAAGRIFVIGAPSQGSTTWPPWVWPARASSTGPSPARSWTKSGPWPITMRRLSVGAWRTRASRPAAVAPVAHARRDADERRACGPPAAAESTISPRDGVTGGAVEDPRPVDVDVAPHRERRRARASKRTSRRRRFRSAVVLLRVASSRGPP